MSEGPLTLSVLSVNVGKPRAIGMRAGVPVMSGIGKAPVSTDALGLSPTGLAGDGQADLTVHGGPDKAVYAYPSDHWPEWTAQTGLACGPGTFGENLTLGGARETEVRIGDVFAWGEALLQISQPRQPCYKLALHLGRDDIGPAMVRSARTGWYFRVTRPGVVPAKGAALERIADVRGAPTVHEIFTAFFDPKATRGRLEELAVTPALADDWRLGFLTRARARA